MAIAFLFGLILILSPITNLRGEAEIGLVDILMVIFAAANFIICFQRVTNLPPSAKDGSFIKAIDQEAVAKFWFWAAPLLVMSTLINISSGNTPFYSINREALAWSATVLTTVSASAAIISQHRVAFASGLCLGSIAVSIVYAGMALTGTIGYNIDARFVGGSLNPNQTALHSLAIITICYFAIRFPTSLSLITRILLVASIICAFVFGISTQSDSFRLASLSILLIFSLVLLEKIFRSRLNAIFVIIILFISVIIFSELSNPGLITSRLDIVGASLQEGNQDVDRISLWANGMAAWQENLIYGNGIGAWSGISGPFEGIEAHNNIIDWLSITGLLGLFFFIRLTLNIFSFPIRLNIDRYMFFMALLMYGMFGFSFRLPIYWLCISIIFYRHNLVNQVEIRND